jgi:hypothetical protein
MAHTPGPWIVREPEEDELYEVYAENGGDLICYPVYTRNQRDNIHLIAAAPDLLAACHKLIDSDAAVEEDERKHQLLLAKLLAAQAIAKAEGDTE